MNPNLNKSKKIIDERIGADKAKLNKMKKKQERRFERNFNKWREYDLLTCLIAVVGLALAIVDWEYTRRSATRISQDFNMYNGCPDNHEINAACMESIAEKRLELCKSNFVRVVIVLVSIFDIITLYFRHAVKARWLNEDLPFELLNGEYRMKLEGREEIDASGFKRRVWFQASFWYEAIIFIICPIPFKDWILDFNFIDIRDKQVTVRVYYLVSDFILVFMFFRIFFVIRAVFNYNMYTDVFAKKLCRSYGFTANVRFTFKSLLKTDPAMTVSTTLFSSVIILAYCLRVFEI